MMFMVLKKKSVFAILIAVIVVTGITGAACHYFGEIRTFLPVEGRVVVIDAGHGGIR